MIKNSKRLTRRKIISDINVTPFVDVLLVLLIIFMVTAPIMISGVNIDLPKGSVKTIEPDKDPISVSINNAGEIFLGEEKTNLEQLPKKLLIEVSGNMDEKIFMRADKSIKYGKIIDIISYLTANGFSKVVLVVEEIEE